MTDDRQAQPMDDYQVGALDFSSLDELMQSLRDATYHLIAREVIAQVFQGPIRQGQVYEFDGDGPFAAGDLAHLTDLLGVYGAFIVDSIEDAQDELLALGFLFVVVGRADFDTDFLDWVLEQLEAVPGSLHVLSQEDFFNYWLFGRYEPYTRDDPRVWDHPALTYLAEHSGPRWPWPSTEPEPSLGTEVDANGWRLEHPLKARFGYTVDAQVGLSDEARRRILDRALTTPDEPLDLKTIVHHLAWQVRWGKKRRSFAQAVAKWEHDLAYLKETYYRNQFYWPETD